MGKIKIGKKFVLPLSGCLLYSADTTLVPGVYSSNPHSGTDDAAGFCLDFGLSSGSGISPLSSFGLTVYVPVT